ncbi:FAD-binding oxidoreductase [Subtercola endophyticus]|uniref:FAD-binding oxidoreductase n=1 Tax=Subtercola endophyticus TaxID=2895559 RepID=UPI001E56F8ED|nr:FAD-binding oxidoreductase [Subtercola endophyticus]UFS59887.1 FAD-binding oxidoreductase [Subtercola endophyticus]
MTEIPSETPSAAPNRLLPADGGFAAAARDGLFNTLQPAETPALIVTPHTEAEVAQAVSDAARAGTKVAIRSGGHSWISASLREASLLIDMAAFDGIEVDVEARTAKVGPAVRGERLSKELAAHGLAFPVGHCGNPAVGGFLLGGGLGLNWGEWLPSCFSIRSMRVVLASGDVVVASADENAELFWLARGSGPGFPGIVTEFEVGLKPLPQGIRLATWMFDLADLAEVTAWVGRVSAALPASVEVSVVLAGPQRPGATSDSAAHIVNVIATAFAADENTALAALAAFDTEPLPDARLIDHLDPVEVAFENLHEGVDATYPEGFRYLADTFWLPTDLHDALPPLAEIMRRAPSGHSYLLTGMPGNGVGATLLPKGEAAYGMHDRSLVVPYVIWSDPADDEANHAWLADLRAVLEPLASGHFISEADLRHSAERVSRSFAADDWPRVQQLIATFDPDGVFCGFPQPS